MKVTATKLNVRSGPGANFRVLRAANKGDVVFVKESSGDWAWIEPGDGWVNAAYLTADTFEPPAPSETEAMFGKPCEPACSAGRVQLPAPIKLGWENAKVTRVACHVLMVPIFTALFNEIHAAGLWHLLKTFDGIYNCRVIKGSANRSTHSWGISVDLNAETNRQGTVGDMDNRIVRIFEKHGFYWGGRFGGKRRDDMHFEFVRH